MPSSRLERIATGRYRPGERPSVDLWPCRGGKGVAQRLVILGTGGNALDVMDIVDAINALTLRWDLIGVLDDAGAGGAERIGMRNLGRLVDAAALAAPGGPLAD